MKLLTLLIVCALAKSYATCSNTCEDCNMICLSSGVSMCYDNYQNLLNQGLVPTNIEVVGVGDCNIKFSEDCLCCYSRPKSYVCGTDNNTYFNLCELECVSNTNYGKLSKLQLLHFSPCSQPSTE